MSRIVECENGHYYDREKFTACPHCIQERRYQRNHIGDGKEKKGERTLRLDMMSNGVAPVIGWLVCIKGFMQGQDYRLLNGFNRIGVQPTDDIVVFDDQIREESSVCSVVCDGKSGNVFLVPEGRVPVYLNGQEIQDAKPVSSGDRIQIYETEYILMLFCPDMYRWGFDE